MIAWHCPISRPGFLNLSTIDILGRKILFEGQRGVLGIVGCLTASPASTHNLQIDILDLGSNSCFHNSGSDGSNLEGKKKKVKAVSLASPRLKYLMGCRDVKSAPTMSNHCHHFQEGAHRRWKALTEWEEWWYSRSGLSREKHAISEQKFRDVWGSVNALVPKQTLDWKSLRFEGLLPHHNLV